MKGLFPLIIMVGLMYAAIVWLKAKVDTGRSGGRNRRSKNIHGPQVTDRESALLAEVRAQYGKETDKTEVKAPFSGERWPVKRKTTLLTSSEKQMFDRLQDALYEHIVLPQVALSQIITCEDGNFGTTWNKISRKVCDYVVCNKDFSVVAVVELDGWSHKYEKQQQKDADKDSAVTSAGLKMVRFDARSIPKGPEIRERLGVTYQ
jgi:hypothetical protein